MRILAAGDIHGDTSLSEKLAETAIKEKVDYVILTGDLTLGDRSTENILGPFIKKNIKVLFIPGNHESFATADFLELKYGAKNMHGSSIKKDDIGFFGCGGANIGIHQLTEKEIYDTLRKGFIEIKDSKKTIMLTHVHPKGTMMEQFTNFFPGSEGVRSAIEQFKPDLLLCSHVHEAEGIEEKIGKTKVINVGRVGKLIDL